MKVSISWLKNYVPIEMDVFDLAEALTMAGLEVESVQDRFGYLDTVRVARIEAIQPHPDAERLKIVRIDTGSGRASVVCGAPNVQTDMRVPWAMPGTELPDGSAIGKSVIRGKTSEGMLCSEAELGLGFDRSGILSLDPTLAPGASLAQALSLSDAVIEIDLTPNRPDCLSVLGIAREIAAIEHCRVNYPDSSLVDEGNSIAAMTSVRIESPDHCPRYAARLVTGVTVAPSPFWLQDRLLSVGLRPINNIVDITNFVLMETGQPLHAFDFDRLDENRIVVRTARPGETFVTLDNSERVLDQDMLMICDGTKPVAVAGVMGGLNSEIEDDTRQVLIESAYFNPRSIRKTSKKLGLSTDASYRFERGIDPEGVIAAANRAARLMVEIGGGRMVDGIIDEYPNRQGRAVIELGSAHTNRLLGTDLKRDQIAALLRSVEFEVAPGNAQDALTVTAPSFRVDVSRPEDLMEEVARLHGYDKIETTFPTIPAEGTFTVPALRLRNRIKQFMAGCGFTEAITYSFISRHFAERLRLRADDPRRRAVVILNPLNEDQAVMRTSLLPGMLATLANNLSQGSRHLKLFEIGKVFIANQPSELPLEIETLIALWSGPRTPADWGEKETPCDFYDIKGVAETLQQALKVDGLRYTASAAENCRYTRAGCSADIMAGNKIIGSIGEIHPQVLTNFDLKAPAYFFEIRLDELAEMIPDRIEARPLPRFPAVPRDITMIVDEALEAQGLLDAVMEMEEPLVESLHLFDVFSGSPIPDGKKSVSFRLVYRSAARTLSDDEVNALHKNIGAGLIKRFSADLPA
jgi:phenylalanyl-tRNA synthetase beta chain